MKMTLVRSLLLLSLIVSCGLYIGCSNDEQHTDTNGSATKTSKDAKHKNDTHKDTKKNKDFVGFF